MDELEGQHVHHQPVEFFVLVLSNQLTKIMFGGVDFHQLDPANHMLDHLVVAVLQYSKLDFILKKIFKNTKEGEQAE